MRGERVGGSGLSDAGAFVILGGSGGIGSAIARRLAGRDATVVLAARSAGPLQTLASEIGATSAVVDASDVEAVERLVKDTAAEHGRVAGIVNAVGSILLKPAHLTAADEWHDTLVDTPLAARITGNPRAPELSRAMHPLGRIGTADDVAAAIEWLLDPATSWVTGQVIGVDGGMSTVRV